MMHGQSFKAQKQTRNERLRSSVLFWKTIAGGMAVLLVIYYFFPN